MKKMKENEKTKRINYCIVIDPILKLKHNLIIKKINTTLADKRGWRKLGYSFNLIELAEINKARHDIIITISPNETVKKICKFDGLSCADYGTYIAHLNMEKWQKGCAGSKLSLQDYRTYMILHEVGHLLDKGHTTIKEHREHRAVCKSNMAIMKAPIMMPQTLGIGDYKPNCWPLSFE